MEKLILRGVMYGADKIPDSWFEKVPGGFYKPSDGKQNGSRGARGDAQRGSRNHRRRYSDERDNRGRESRNKEYQDYRKEEEAFYAEQPNDRHRARGSRRRSRSVGGGDYNNDADRYGESMSRRHGESGRHRRRHSNNDDRYGYDDSYGHGRPPPPRDERYDYPPSPNGDYARAPYPRDGPPTGAGTPYVPPLNPGVAAAAAAGGAAGAAAARGGPYHNGTPQSSNPQPRAPTSANGAGVATGYVPYSNIYGAPANQAAQPTFSPPPASYNGSVQPNSMNQVIGPEYANPFSPTTSVAGGAPPPTNNPQYSARHPGYGPDPRYDDRYYDEYEDQRYGYDLDGIPYHSPPREERQRRYSRSPSRDSDAPSRRARSERRSDRARPQDDKRGKSVTRLKEKLDTTERGLGYGAVGAVAGGLVASELGKGPLAAALGAAIGGIGANVFQARERFVDPRALAQSSTMTDARYGTIQPSMPPMQQTQGKKEAARNTEWSRDPALASRREDKDRVRRDEAERSRGGYYSD